MATSMLLSENLVDRQSTAIADLRDAQRRLLEATFELSLAGADAIGQLNRSVLTVLVDLMERATATSLRSAEPYATLIPPGADGQVMSRDTSSSRRPKEAAAA